MTTTVPSSPTALPSTSRSTRLLKPSTFPRDSRVSSVRFFSSSSLCSLPRLATLQRSLTNTPSLSLSCKQTSSSPLLVTLSLPTRPSPVPESCTSKQPRSTLSLELDSRFCALSFSCFDPPTIFFPLSSFSHISTTRFTSSSLFLLSPSLRSRDSRSARVDKTPRACVYSLLYGKEHVVCWKARSRRPREISSPREPREVTVIGACAVCKHSTRLWVREYIRGQPPTTSASFKVARRFRMRFRPFGCFDLGLQGKRFTREITAGAQEGGGNSL